MNESFTRVTFLLNTFQKGLDMASRIKIIFINGYRFKRMEVEINMKTWRI